MKHYQFACLFSSLLFLFFGCATYIPIKIQRPAQLDVPPFKKIAVLDFSFTGQWSFWYDNEIPGTFEDIAKKVIIDKLGLDKREKPDPRKAFPGSEVSAQLAAALVKNGHYEVLERAQLGKILAEHSLILSGAIDETQAAQVGKLLGVDGLLLGTGAYSMSDGGEWVQVEETVSKTVPADSGKTKTVEEKVMVRKFNAYRKIQSELTYKIVDVTTSRIVVANTNTNSTRLKSQENREQEAFQSLPDWRPTVSDLVDDQVSAILHQIAPYSVYENRKIKSGKSKLMKSALDYAKRNMIEDAKKMWEQVASDQSPKNLSDRVGALCNLAVYAEVTGDLDKSEELYNTCYQLSGKTEYLDNRALIQRRKKEAERLKEQVSP